MLPKDFDVKLTYAAKGDLNNVGGIAASKYWQPTSAYDVDPALGSTPTAGYAELTAMFRYYRVLKFQVRLEVINMDEFPVTVCEGPFNLTPPGATVGYDVYVGNPLFRRHILSPLSSGTPKAIFMTPWIDVANFVGDEYVRTDPNYASVTNSVPANKVFHGFSIAPVKSGLTLVNGVGYIINIDMATRFTERVVLDA
jgi:hypothetical protein